MLTVLRYLSPNSRDKHYSIMVEYCASQVKYYCELKNAKKASYWSKLATKYLLKRTILLQKKLGSR